MMNIKRLLTKFNIFRIKMKRLEEENKILWSTVDILSNVSRITAELRNQKQREEEKQSRALKVPHKKKYIAYTEERLKKIFGVE